MKIFDAGAAPGLVVRDRATRALLAGTIVLIHDSVGGATYSAALAEHLDAFTLERLESLSAQRATLVVGTAIARRHDLADGHSVDATRGIGDGGSVADRARTMRVVASTAPDPALSSPGHVEIGTRIGPVTALAFELVRRGGGREAVAMAALCDPQGNLVASSQVRVDPRLAHLARESTRGCRPAVARYPRAPSARDAEAGAQ